MPMLGSGIGTTVNGGDGAVVRPGISVRPGSLVKLVSDEAAGLPAGIGVPDDRAGFREGGFCAAPLADVVPVGGGGSKPSGSGVRFSRSAGLEFDVSTSRTAVGCIVHLVTVAATAAAAAATSASFTAEKNLPP